MKGLARVSEEIALAPAELARHSREERLAIGKMWAARAESELTAGVVFANIGLSLLEHGAAAEVAFLTTRAVSDEVRHAEICRHVAARYLDAEVAFPRPRRVEKPPASGNDGRLVATLHLVLNSCLNESVAVVFLRSCLDQAENGLVRLALRELMGEEVDHARVGWAHLASPAVTDRERAAVGRAVPGLIAELEKVWLANNTDEVPRGHGTLTANETEKVVAEALADLILPGFEHCGVAVAK